MRVLLDECLPRKLRRDLGEHDVATVPEVGWAGTKNGELLRLAEEQFDAFVTIDRRIASAGPQRLRVVVLTAPSNRLESLRPLVPELLHALRSA